MNRVDEYLKASVLLALLIATLFIRIPIGIVPVTLQTFFIGLIGVIMGPKYGLFTICVYLIMGFIGLPVFAGYTNGITLLFTMSGGYILGMPIAAFICGFSNRTENIIFKFIIIYLGLSSILFFGITYMILFFDLNFISAFSINIPFFVIEFFKAFFIVIIYNELNKREVI